MEALISEPISEINPYADYMSALQELENQLNSYKDQLNPSTFPDLEDLKRKTNWEKSVFQLRKTLRSNLKAQGVTKAWLKLQEILLLPQVSSRLLAMDKISGFFNADLPGAFTLAANHFAQSNNKPFDWVISSYIPRQNEGKNYLDDTLGLIQNNSGNSLVGFIETNKGSFYCDGDLTHPEMPEILSTLAKSVLNQINLYTSDGGFATVGQENLQEILHNPLKIGEIETGLRSLTFGGIMIVKLFTFFSPEMLTALSQLILLFDDFMIYKPKTSGPMNSEVYFVGLGFKGASNEIIQRFNKGLKGETKVFVEASNLNTILANGRTLKDEILIEIQLKTNNQMVHINKFLSEKEMDDPGLTDIFMGQDKLKSLVPKQRIKLS